MGLMVPVLAGYIAYSIADRPGLAVGFTGGLLASSGNALVTGYNWADSTTGFQKFIADFAFQGANGGNTVSGFLGGILAGFLAGFIVLFLKKAFSKLPASLDGIKPTLIYPLLGILIISILMCFIFNPLIGLINTGLSNGLTAISDAGYITVLGLILGAMMAIDMGGPINKAAYVFGTGVLATASQMIEKGAQPGDPGCSGMLHCHGSDHGRWYGSSDRNRACLPVLPEEIYKGRTWIQGIQLCNGCFLHQRGCDPVCSSRSASRNSMYLNWCRSCRIFIRTV